MNADAIRIVSEAIRAVLGPAVGGAGNVYVGPLDDQAGRDARIVLFLYRVAVNSHLRNAEHRVAAADPKDPVVVHKRSLPLDLCYLLTAGNRETGGEATALADLGLAMQVLNATPDLVGRELQNETVRLTLDPIGSEEMSRIWTLFPTINYRTSVTYVASPVWIDPATPPVDAVPVTEEPHRFRQKPRAMPL